MEDSKLHEETLKIAKSLIERDPALKDWVTEKFPELKESEDEKMIRIITETLQGINKKDDSMMGDILLEDCIAWLEKQGEQKPQGKPALEVWKDMRLEVYQQASGNRHEPNYSDDSTKMFSLTDIDEIFEKVAEKQGEQKPAWSEEDEKMIETICKEGNLKPSEQHWLKSFKPNHWKPSEFQLKCLEKVIPHNNTEKDCELEDVLTELYNDLKKL